MVLIKPTKKNFVNGTKIKWPDITTYTIEDVQGDSCRLTFKTKHNKYGEANGRYTLKQLQANKCKVVVTTWKERLSRK